MDEQSGKVEVEHDDAGADHEEGRFEVDERGNRRETAEEPKTNLDLVVGEWPPAVLSLTSLHRE